MSERDRHGATLSELHWTPGGALAEARVRLPDHTWLTILPAASREAPWGLSDVLVRDGRPLTLFRALDWTAISTIPPLAEPFRLPPGAGSAVLNLVATLAADQGRVRVTYDGPYPTEQLFLALLESFHYVPPPTVDALAAFMAGNLVWTPAPHVRLFDPRGAYVQGRERVEKVISAGRAYYRAEWQAVQRRAPRRVRDADDGVRCSLWALGAPLEDHVILEADGEVRAILSDRPEPAGVEALPAAAVSAVVALVAAQSAPALDVSLRRVAAARRFEWGPVGGDLIATDETRVRFATRLRAAIAQRLARAPGRSERAAVALAALGELALLAGDELRIRAQEALAAASEPEQVRALSAVEPPIDAAALAAGVTALAGQLLA